MASARMLTTACLCLLLALVPGAGLADPGIAGQGPRVPPVHDIDRLVDASDVSSRMRSLLISQGGEIIYERYFNDFGPDDLTNVKSVSKSILSALIGIAISERLIYGVDTKIDEYFGEEMVELGDPAIATISIENLLTMQAGLRPTSNVNYGAWVQSDNWVSAALEMPMEATPGREMLYSTGNTHLLSAIIARASGRTTLDFAREALAEPLGFDLAPWPRDPQGIYFGGNDMELTPRQMLAFGELYLNDGRIDGHRVIPESWVRASLMPRAKSPHGDSRYYGYGWWSCDLAGHFVPHAWGHGGQFIMLVPDLDLVLVTTSAPYADAAAHEHANKVYGLLQRLIRNVDDYSTPHQWYADRGPNPVLH
jgi:CubicO group peptidase (beta-lactamase class C family)